MGRSFIDQNGYRLPHHPLLPIFKARDTLEVESGGAAFEWNTVDIVTDRNNLLKLLEWADPKGCNRPAKSKNGFRIDVQLVGSKTILFQRWEERRSVWANGGFGDPFEKASSRPAAGCEKATLAGHMRIVTYVRTQCINCLSCSHVCCTFTACRISRV